MPGRLDTSEGGARSQTGTRSLAEPPCLAEPPPFVELEKPLVSLVIPTRDEVDNVKPLLARLARAAPEEFVELVFVDDSDDGTDEALRRAAQSYPRGIAVLHREPGQRQGGLGGAVVEGMRAAQGTWICILDADLQHPPEVIEQMLERAQSAAVDLVIASRFAPGGSTGDFGRLRRLLSRGSTSLARLAFSRALSRTSDPMSGFFLVRRQALDLDALEPQGFKILLEILVRTPTLRTAEVPFVFGERQAGESKARLSEARNYLLHLWRLRLNDTTLRFTRFVTVGLTGLAVNTLLLALFTGVGGLYYLLSAVLATQGSTLWNFVGTEAWVFRGRERRHGTAKRVAMFFAVNNVALLLRGPVLYLLTSFFGIYYLVSNILSMALLTLARYAFSDRLIWAKSKPRRTPASHFYSIHDILTVDSTVALPELERFRVERPTQPPTISVRIGKVSARAEKASEVSHDALRYDEGLGAAGFATKIAIDEEIHVLASPLLRHSPHVLYTNIVEPLLRWTFVERGYALVHGACIACGREGFLITARTDTGKTTTILKTLDSQPSCSFLSDDLTLVRPDGVVLCYPKPLTISRHTVEAVKTPLLSRRERIALIFQSRIHSRSGRQFAFLLTRMRLPVATINTIVQMLVPPPKYHVDRLVPGVLLAGEARLAGLIVIQRGDDASAELRPEEAMSILLENCEDAYGFPPYAEIEGFLHSRNGSDLRSVEHAIIESALSGRPATLLARSRRDWNLLLPALMSGRLRAVGQPLPAEENGRVASPQPGHRPHPWTPPAVQ